MAEIAFDDKEKEKGQQDEGWEGDDWDQDDFQKGGSVKKK